MFILFEFANKSFCSLQLMILNVIPLPNIGVWKSKIRVLAWLGSGEDCLEDGQLLFW